MNLFIKTTDTFLVDVYVWEKDGKTETSLLKDGADPQAELIKLTFRKPSFKDSTRIMQKSQHEGRDAGVIVFQEELLRSLLVSIETKSDGIIPATQKVIDELNPSIATAAVSGVLDKVKVY